MRIVNAFSENKSINTEYFEIEASDVLTSPVKVKINHSIGNQTVNFPAGTYDRIWFELKTSVVGVTGTYDGVTGEVTVTKATNWVAGDAVVILYSIFKTKNSLESLV